MLSVLVTHRAGDPPICVTIGSFRLGSLPLQIWLIRVVVPESGARLSGGLVLCGCGGREQGGDHGLCREVAVVLR
jgi:hypothetical protein